MRLENVVKKHDKFKICVEENKEEVEYGSGDTSYTVVFVSLFVVASTLGCFFLKGVVVMGSSKPITMKVSVGWCYTPLCHVFL
jgi:hypothetical protein